MNWTYGVIIPWQPHSKTRPRISAPRKGQAPRTHQDPKDKAAEIRTREHLQSFGFPVLTGNVAISAHFYRATRQVVDMDNLLKHILDCGNGVIYVDDCQVTRYVDIRLGLDRENPRTELWVHLDSETTMKRGTDFE